VGVALVFALCSGSGDTTPPSVTQTGACQLPSGFVAIQPGTFQMGEVGVAEPVHAVTISYPFWMGAKEVTQAEYAALMYTNPSGFQGNASRPVEQVTWHDARSYCAALTAQQAALGAVPSGYEYRLPTEAEWEYACRAGTTTSWNVGNSLSCSQANHESCIGDQTSVVGSYAPNTWGLYDIARQRLGVVPRLACGLPVERRDGPVCDRRPVPGHPRRRLGRRLELLPFRVPGRLRSRLRVLQLRVPGRARPSSRPLSEWSAARGAGTEA
jgi:hypothetical protein